MDKLKMFLVLSLAVVLGFSVGPACAELPTVTGSLNTDAVYEINNATPGLSKTFLGTRLQGLLQTETASISSAGEQDLDEADSVIRFTTSAVGGTSEAAFGEGYDNQITTFVLVTDNGNSVDITPTTKTGFTSITLDDAGASCSIRYVDSTVGWTLAGNSGCIIDPVEKATVSGSGEQDLDENDTYIQFATGAGLGIFENALGGGSIGHNMTVSLVTDGGSNVDITPTTKTGFASITLNDANDSCTLRYVDSTVGWVVAGNNGCTIN